MTFRIQFIQFLLALIERLFFYPKLAAYYKREILDKNLVVVDVGANRGQSINFFIKHFFQVTLYAFEPNPRLFQNLKEKYKSNSLIFLFNKGISSINGELTFSETVLDETSTLEELNFSSVYLQKKAKILGVKPEKIIKETYCIEVITLADFLASNKISKIDILKIDTEGHEYKCLQGLFKNKQVDVRYIQLENHNDDMYLNRSTFRDIENLLIRNGFILDKRIKHGFGDFDELVFKKLI